MAKNKVEINGINTNKLVVLSHEEMISLFTKFKEGDKNAKNIIVEGNLKLILSILKKYQGRCDNLDDLFQIGTIGLIKAVDNFNLSFGVKFSTYAVLMIEGEIKRYIRDNTGVRISRSIKELSYAIVNFKEEFLSKNFRYPTNEEICLNFGITEYELYNSLNSLTEITSIFDPIYNDGGDTIYLIDQLEEKKSLELSELIALKEAILKIKDRERIVIMKRYIEGLSQAEIANLLQISQAQVSRIENSALNSVKKLIM